LNVLKRLFQPSLFDLATDDRCPKYSTEVLTLKFRAYAITNEIDLNKIAARCGIPKKYTWEEPLILQGGPLEEILGYTPASLEMILIFAFGSIVFINTKHTAEQPVFEYLKTIQRRLRVARIRKTTDHYGGDTYFYRPVCRGAPL
jgi:RNA polymerase subunit RPABC4/transcription elongation factor Spt4